MKAEQFVKEKGRAVHIHFEPNDDMYIRQDDVYRLMEEYRTARLEARTFKILVHNGWCVDTMMLPKGIYSSITPQLYQPTATIQELVDEAKKMKRRGIDIGGYIENVKRCQLKVVELSV